MVVVDHLMAVTRCCRNMFQSVVVGVNMGVVVIYIFMEHQATKMENMNKIEIVFSICLKYIR